MGLHMRCELELWKGSKNTEDLGREILKAKWMGWSSVLV